MDLLDFLNVDVPKACISVFKAVCGSQEMLNMYMLINCQLP